MGLGLSDLFNTGRFFHTATTLRDHFGFDPQRPTRTLPMKGKGDNILYGYSAFQEKGRKISVIFDIPARHVYEDAPLERSLRFELTYKRPLLSPEFHPAGTAIEYLSYEIEPSDSRYSTILAHQTFGTMEKMIWGLLNVRDGQAAVPPSKEEILELVKDHLEMYSFLTLLTMDDYPSPRGTEDREKRRRLALVESRLSLSEYKI